MTRGPRRKALILTAILAAATLLPLIATGALAQTSGPVRIQDPATNTCGNPSFGDIPSALACALGGAKILVEPGTYTGALTLSTSVTLCSTTVGGTECDPQRANTILDGGGSIYLVHITAADTTLRGFTLRNPTFTATGFVDPSLVVVDAARVRLQDNALESPAAPLLPGESRFYTVGINVVNGPDLLIERTTLQRLPSSQAGATCTQAPCRTIGVVHSAGARLVLRNTTIDLAGAGESAALTLSAPDARVQDNTFRLASGNPGAVSSVGLRGPDSGLVRNVSASGNLIVPATGEVQATAYGAYLRAQDSAFANNTFRDLLHGLYLRSSPLGGNSVSGNLFERSNEGIRNYAADTRIERNTFNLNVIGIAFAGGPGNGGTSAGAVLRDNTFSAQHQFTLRLMGEVNAVLIDAQQNHWSVYNRTQIRNTIDDAGSNNVIDITCFLDADRTSKVCPPTVTLSANATTQSWRKPIAFNASVVTGGRPIQRVTFQFGEGNAATSGTTTDAAHAYAAPGTYDAKVILTDTEGYNASATRTVTIINRAPVIHTTGPYSVAENATLDFTLDASDADADPLTWSAPQLPRGAAFDPATRRVTWTPDFTQEGNHTARFDVTDGLQSASALINIQVTHVNAPPFLEPIGNRSGAEGQPLVFYVRASDVDGNATIRFSAIGPPTGSTFIDHQNGTSRFSWTPSYTQAGVHAVIFEARDGEHEVREIVDLHIADVDRPPAFTPIPTQTIPETQRLQFFVSATDPDGASLLTYAAPSLPAGATFDPSKRLFLWTPGYNDAGTHTAKFNVTDGNHTVNTTATIIVTNTNRPPGFYDVPPKVVSTNRTLIFQVQAVDPDGDALTYSLADTPANATLSPTSGVFAWRPVATQVGAYALHFIANDGGLAAHLNVSVTVANNAPPVLLIHGPAIVDAGTGATFNPDGSFDPEGTSPLYFEWDSDPNDGFQAERTGRLATFVFNDVGPRTITLRGTDLDGFVAYKTFNLTVDDRADIALRLVNPPELTQRTLIEATLTLTGATPVAGTPITLDVSYNPTPTSTHLATLTATTDANGIARFELPFDQTPINLPGRHVVTATTTVPTSYLGDEEQATSTLTYSVLLS